MNYFITETLWNKETTYLDIVAFGTALAKELGASVVKTEEGYYGRCNIAIGGVELYMSRAELKSGKWKLRIGSSCALDGHMLVSIYERPVFPSINVDPTRDIASIAKDVTRRLLKEAEAPLKKMNELISKYVQQKANLEKSVRKVRETVPNCTVRTDTDYQSDIDLPGMYLGATVHHTGRVAIRHMPDVSIEKFAEILAILRNHE